MAPEDDDGNAASKPKSTVDQKLIADHLAAIDATTTEEELKAAYLLAYKAAGTDAALQKKFIAAKDAKKASLT